MSELTIVTNNVPRLILDWNQLSKKDQDGFLDLMDLELLECGDFVKYKGHTYFLGDFTAAFKGDILHDKGWKGYIPESFYSGVVVKYCEDDNNYAIMGMYIS